MKEQKFSDQQLKDFVSGKEVVVCEPVKEGEDIELWKCSNCGYEIRKPPIDKILKNPYYRELFINNKNEQIKPCPNDCARTISENKISGLKKYAYSDLMVGELVQALNEKGEKAYYCPTCNNIAKVIIKSDNSICCGVRLIKQGKKKAQETLEQGFNPLLVRLEKIEREETPLLGGLKINKWLKTWVKE